MFSKVFNIERDITKAKSGEDKELIYKTITGLKIDDAVSSEEDSDDDAEEEESCK